MCVTLLCDGENVRDTGVHDDGRTLETIDEDTIPLTQDVVTVLLCSFPEGNAMIADIVLLVVVTHSFFDDIFFVVIEVRGRIRR